MAIRDTILGNALKMRRHWPDWLQIWKTYAAAVPWTLLIGPPQALTGAFPPPAFKSRN